jgi:hypothetical protein
MLGNVPANKYELTPVNKRVGPVLVQGAGLFVVLGHAAAWERQESDTLRARKRHEKAMLAELCNRV